jgi:hypothetical protein
VTVSRSGMQYFCYADLIWVVVNLNHPQLNMSPLRDSSPAP